MAASRDVAPIDDVDGAVGRIDLTRRFEGALRVRAPDGQVLLVPGGLVDEDRRGIHLRTRFAELMRAGARPERVGRRERATIPVVEEQLRVDRRRVPVGGARVHVRVRETPRVVEDDADIDEVEVERVPVDAIVDRWQPERVEGDVTIIPVHEEVLRVTRELRVVEEVRIRRTRRREHRRHEVVLRREEVDVQPIERKDE
jgi:stress response protein YsnF